jgi:hypothetical protein
VTFCVRCFLLCFLETAASTQCDWNFGGGWKSKAELGRAFAPFLTFSSELREQLDANLTLTIHLPHRLSIVTTSIASTFSPIHTLI